MKALVYGMAAAGMVGVAVAGDDNKLVIDGSTTVGPIAKAFAEYYMKAHPEVKISVSESGSGNGAKGIINGTIDIGTMSRAMKDSEKKSAKDAGQLPIQHVVALDGLAVVVHKANPVKGLTPEQIKKVYSGEIANWKELGGPDRQIVVVSRDTNSGTYESFETLVMKGAKIVGSAEYVGSNGAIRQRVMSTENAIGYVGIAFTADVKVLEVNGVLATIETVQEKKYPISRELYMYTNGRPKAGSHVANFIGLTKSADGMKLIEDVGFVPVK